MTNKLLLAIFSLPVFAAATFAQGNPEQAILNAREQFSNIKNRSIEMERIKREAYKRPANKDSTPKFPEIKEDFEQIQKLNGEIFRLTAGKTPVSPAAVFKFASEINHRAARLKSNLFSVEPKSKKAEKKEAKNKLVIEAQELKNLFAALDESVNRFAHSSIFQNINLVNSDDSLKAQKELQTIIEVSDAIKIKTKH